MSIGASNGTVLNINSSDQIQISTGDGTTAYNFVSTALYRDPSAWYHILFVCNTTSATSTQTGTTSDRLQMWVNGVQLSSFSTNQVPSQNFAGLMNTTNAHYIGSDVGTASYLNGYLAEVNFIDGQALTPSSFGAYDTNGVWQPAKYTGSYGTNGFYLTFGNTTSTATLGNDSSGNSNTWTVNNISLTAGSTYDSMTDSPTVTSASVANYAVLNPLQKNASLSVSNGNLTIPQQTIAGNYYGVGGSLGVSSGKFYFEVTASASSSSFNDTTVGFCKPTDAITTTASGVASTVGFLLSLGNGVTSNYGTTTSVTGLTLAATNVLQVAIDIGAGKIWFGADGTWSGSGNPSAGTNPNYSSGIAGNSWIPAVYYWGAGTGSRTASANFGQQPFSYTPPTGFNALNTYNLPTPAITNGAKYFAATTYTGTGATQSITNGGNNTIGTTFRPDLIWGKQRNGASSNVLTDVLRGVNSQLSSNSTNAEQNQTDVVTAFNSNGFTVGASAGFNMNQSGSTLVAWQWNANGAGVSNTNGSITSTVSANTTAGFSVVTYTGTGANATVGHGLGVAPNMIIVKQRNAATADWGVYHSSIGNTGFVKLNTTDSTITVATMWNNTSPTSSVFSLGTNITGNGSTTTYVAYCFAAIAGYSAFGSYTGNGSTDGPFVYTGFRPRFILTKRTDATNTWELYDTSRSTYNAATAALYPNTSAAETTDDPVDLLSNGFKPRGTGNAFNTSGGTYIYAAFAENPFNYSRGR
jgi:hypothetical protein